MKKIRNLIYAFSLLAIGLIFTSAMPVKTDARTLVTAQTNGTEIVKTQGLPHPVTEAAEQALNFRDINDYGNAKTSYSAAAFDSGKLTKMFDDGNAVNNGESFNQTKRKYCRYRRNLNKPKSKPTCIETGQFIEKRVINYIKRKYRLKVNLKRG